MTASLGPEQNANAVVVLIGAPGAGKSTIGSLIAQRLDIPWIDTDREVERLAAMSVAEIFTVHGEGEFRRWEEQACLTAFAQRAVVSLGGGAPTIPAVQAALGSLPTVWLQATIADIAERVKLDVPRPLLLGDTRKVLTQLMAQRQPIYESAAALAVSTSGRSPDEIVDEIIAHPVIAAAISAKEGN